MPAVRSGRSAASVTVTGAGPGPATVTPRSTSAPPSEASSAHARASAGPATSGSTPRSNRLDASLGSLCRRMPREIVAGCQCAASSTTSVVSGPISVAAPPMIPASAIGPDSSVTSRSSGSSVRRTPSRVSSFSPGRARRTVIGPVSRPRSNACIGWPVSSIT